MALIREPFEAKKDLVKSGMADEQAEAIIQLLSVADERVASHKDMQQLQQSINKDILELEKRFVTKLELQSEQFNNKLLKMSMTTTLATAGILSLLSAITPLFGN